MMWQISLRQLSKALGTHGFTDDLANTLEIATAKILSKTSKAQLH